MRANRTLVASALTLVVSFGFSGRADALTVCRTPDGVTYASDQPPPDCAPIPTSELDRFPPYSEQRGETDGRSPIGRARRSVDGEPAAIAEPSTADESPMIAEPPHRAAADEAPESDRTHAIASCEQAVAEQLERPSSARWPNRSDYRMSERGGRYQISGRVEAEQALGSSQVDWTCDAAYGGDRWIASALLKREESPPPVSRPSAPESYPPARSAAAEAVPSMRESVAAPPPVAAAPPIVAPPPSLAAAPPPPPEAPIASAPYVPSAPVASAEVWRERSSCPGVKFDASTERHPGYQMVSGEITYTGMRPIRDVRVCASGVCVQVASGMTMTQGASQRFMVRTPNPDTPVVTAQCSVMVDGPGL